MEATTNKTLAIRFSEEKYARREDVRNELKMSMIDGIWESILKYRNLYKKNINLYSLSSFQYFYCFVQSANGKINDITSKASKCVSSYLRCDNYERDLVQHDCFKKAIQNIGLLYNEELSSEFIESILNKQLDKLQWISENKKKADNYYQVIKSLMGTTHNVDEDFLVTLYVNLSHNDNITSIYRTFDFPDNTNTVINRNYSNGAPKGRIEQCMKNLYTFLASNDYSTLVKAATAFYYITYIKPFDSYNEEIALLTFKTIIANDDKQNVTYLFPFETILLRKTELSNIYREIDRTNDLTYVLFLIFEDVDASLNNFINSYNRVKSSVLEREHLENLDENPKNNLTEPKTPKTEENKEINRSINIKEVSIPSIANELDEKDAIKFEKYLLEKNPLLKPAQAHFYARHCTLGSFYTIQMFKKYEKGVYETARTSMDALRDFGYYKKEQIKNKFVYTPIKLENK